MLGYVLVTLDRAKEQEVYEDLRDIPDVREVHILFGEWDLIVKIESPTPEALAQFVMEKIRSLAGVKYTSTMIVTK